MNRDSELRRTPMPARKAPLPRSEIGRNQGPKLPVKPKRQKAPRDTGPSRATVIAVAERDGWECVRCGGACHGTRGWDWSVQHRRARGMGGDPRPDTNEPQNLILLCGSATSPGGCHLRVESRKPEDADAGWSISRYADPLLKPVLHHERGFIYLFTDDGWGSRPATPTTTAEEAPRDH